MIFPYVFPSKKAVRLVYKDFSRWECVSGDSANALVCGPVSFDGTAKYAEK